MRRNMLLHLNLNLSPMSIQALTGSMVIKIAEAEGEFSLQLRRFYFKYIGQLGSQYDFPPFVQRYKTFHLEAGARPRYLASPRSYDRREMLQRTAFDASQHSLCTSILQLFAFSQPGTAKVPRSRTCLKNLGVPKGSGRHRFTTSILTSTPRYSQARLRRPVSSFT